MTTTRQRVLALCRGDADRIAAWLAEPGWRAVAQCCAVIAVGCGIYGFTVGLWRSPLQSLFTAVKFPLLILLTCGGNALLNGLLALLLGAGLSLRQTSLAILMSFTIAAVILGALSPVTLFFLYNTPPLAPGTASTGHSVTLLLHVGLIAYAGIVANHRLLRLLRHLSPRVAVALFLSWLAGNLFLGAQLSWVLRPFIGSPGLPIQFLRDEPMRGNFYEAVWSSLLNLLT